MPLRAILATKRQKSDTIVQCSKPYNVKTINVELELPAAGENFQNLRFFIQFGALFQQSGRNCNSCRETLRETVWGGGLGSAWKLWGDGTLNYWRGWYQIIGGDVYPHPPRDLHPWIPSSSNASNFQLKYVLHLQWHVHSLKLFDTWVLTLHTHHSPTAIYTHP